MVETRFTKDWWKQYWWKRNIVQIVCVNVPFLVIRAAVFSMFGKDESIFIAKNGIGIVPFIMEIHDLRDLRRVRHGNQGDQGQ